MHFGLAEIEISVVSFTDGPGDIDDTGFGFQRHSETGTKVGMVGIVFEQVLSPAPIGKEKEK
jgi:hypothetical protein